MVASFAGAREVHAAGVGQETTLPNGLRVVLVENHASPRVSVQIVYSVGASRESDDERGLTALTMWMMTERTQHVPRGRFKASLDRAGGDWSYSPGDDEAWVKTTVPSNFVELPLWLLSDEMGFFDVPWDQAGVDEGLAFLAQRRTRWADSGPTAVASRLQREEVFPEGSPYRAAAADPLTHFSVDAVRAFHDRWFTPKNAVLAIGGDIQRDAVLELVTKYFGSLSGSAPPPPPTPTPTRLAGEVTLSVAARVPTAQVSIDWPTPPLYAPGDAELDVVAGILEGDRINTLLWELTSRRGIAASSRAHQNSYLYGSRFSIGATATQGHTAEELRDAIDFVLKDLQTNAPSEDYVAGGEANLLIARALSYEDLTRITTWVASATSRGGSPDFLTRDAQRYDLTGARVRDAALRYLPKGRRVVTLISPSPTAPVNGELLSRTVKPAPEAP